MHNDTNLMWLLMQVMFKSKRAVGLEAEAHDLTFMQATALHLLDQDQPQPMRTLSDSLTCDASTITGLVDRLEARGLIVRQNHPSDRRVKLLALTKQGKKLRAEIMDRTMAAEDDRLSTILSKTEISQLRSILHKLLTNG